MLSRDKIALGKFCSETATRYRVGLLSKFVKVMRGNSSSSDLKQDMLELGFALSTAVILREEDGN